MQAGLRQGSEDRQSIDSDQGVEAAIAQFPPAADPFGGFGGYSFFYFCKSIEIVTGWTRPRNRSEAGRPLLSGSRFTPKWWLATLLGSASIALVAGSLIPLFYSSSIKSFLPIAFLLIIIAAALLFGRTAGVLGTIAAGFLFAYFLFEPEGLAISDPVAKQHVIWMLILGVALSDLLNRYRLRRVGSQKFKI